MTAATIGTAAMTSPVVELVSRVSPQHRREGASSQGQRQQDQRAQGGPPERDMQRVEVGDGDADEEVGNPPANAQRREEQPSPARHPDLLAWIGQAYRMRPLRLLTSRG
jgi:hypothetical protein